MATGTQRAYDVLRGNILAGVYAPGAKLSEVALAESLQASRTPIREALRLLARDGLVEVSPHRGARVVRWDTDDLEDLFSLRAVLESHGAGRAARFRTPAQLERMHRLVEAMDDLGTTCDESAVAQRTRLNNELHQEIVAAAGSVRLRESLGSLIHVPLIMRTFAVYSQAATARSQQQHRDLVAAVREQNVDLARAVMTAHILSAYQEIDAPEQGVPGQEET